MMSKTASLASERDGLSLRPFLVLLWCCFVVLPAAWGSDRKETAAEALLQTGAGDAVRSLASPWTVDQALADFDGDRQPDLARTEVLGVSGPDGRYRVNVTLSRGGVSSFEFRLAQPAGVNLEARDIDGDHDLDLVITAGVFHQPVGLWINDGAGTFTLADASLYPDSVWRSPPVIGSSPVPLNHLQAILVGFPFGLASPSYSVSEPLLPRGGLRRTHVPSHRSLFLSGPLSVRPPPSC